MSKWDNPNTMAKKIIDWLNTEKGKKALEDSMRRTNETVKELRKSRQIDWRTLHTPFGPVDGTGIWPHQRI